MNYEGIQNNLENAAHCIELHAEREWRGNREAILKEARRYLVNAINIIDKELLK